MEKFTQRYNPDDVEWHHIVGAPDFTQYKLDYEYTILGCDIPSGRLDMMMRFQGNGGHCERHRHVASTTTLILEGEQHLEEHQPDGSVKHIVRQAGEYSLAEPDALPHMERGGPEGCVLLLSLHAPDGILFEVLDQQFEKIVDVPIEDFVARWTAR
ncbi:MAG: hypothetical protein AAF512_20580 [Pseudomonadota bacterium]